MTKFLSESVVSKALRFEQPPARQRAQKVHYPAWPQRVQFNQRDEPGDPDPCLKPVGYEHFSDAGSEEDDKITRIDGAAQVVVSLVRATWPTTRRSISYKHLALETLPTALAPVAV